MFYRKRLPQMGLFLVLSVASLAAPLGATQGGRNSLQGDHIFSQLVQIVAESDENAQQDFTWIALSELTAAYEKVFLNSRAEVPKGSKARKKLSSWRNGTRRYISELHGLLDRLGGPVEIQMQAEIAGPPAIYIDGNPVILSGPEIGSAKLMERRIIDTYCALYDCSKLTRPAEPGLAENRAAGGGIWSLKNFGKASYETPDGLVFTFSGLSRRGAKQEICEAIALEMRSLVVGLRDAIHAGHLIDWNNLKIQRLPGDRGHRVEFNKAGEYLRLHLPTISRFELLVPGVLVWIRQRTIGGLSVEVEIFADRLLLEGSVE